MKQCELLDIVSKNDKSCGRRGTFGDSFIIASNPRHFRDTHFHSTDHGQFIVQFFRL